MDVWEAMGDHIVDAYSRTGLMIALYVVSNVYFCFPQRVDVSALRMLSRLRACVQMLLMCGVYVSFVSSVSPRILGV